MSKQILIELVGENETGYCYADLYLPASAEEIAEAKERANWNSDSNGILTRLPTKKSAHSYSATEHWTLRFPRYNRAKKK